ncbi:MAG: type II toxin-antitoxin system RelE/ParE family toxin [Acidiferrobacterales bacterium]
MIEVHEYLTTDGKSPFSAWLKALRDRQARARILTRLNRVRLGNFGDCKPIGDGVFELRMMFGPGYRVYFGREGKQVILLLCGGDKGTQDQDIESSRSAWRDYRSRDHG